MHYFILVCTARSFAHFCHFLHTLATFVTFRPARLGVEEAQEAQNDQNDQNEGAQEAQNDHFWPPLPATGLRRRCSEPVLAASGPVLDPVLDHFWTTSGPTPGFSEAS